MPFPVSSDEINLPFEKFPCVNLFGEPHSRSVPTVSSFHSQSMELVLTKLLKCGYRYPALILAKGLSRMLHHGWWMAFIAYSSDFSKTFTYFHDDFPIDFSDLAKWSEKRKVDSLIFCCSENSILNQHKVGRVLPKHIGVICMDIIDRKCGLSGIYQNRFQGGSVAVEWLHSMILTSYLGVTFKHQSIMIPGVWEEGTTCPVK